MLDEVLHGSLDGAGHFVYCLLSVITQENLLPVDVSEVLPHGVPVSLLVVPESLLDFKVSKVNKNSWME